MKQETEKLIREKWLPALRSGEYKQGAGLLKQLDPANNAFYCCLGVLCELKEGVEQVNDGHAGAIVYFKYDEEEYGSDEVMPHALAKELGITPDGTFFPSIIAEQAEHEDYQIAYRSLAELNDRAGWDFPKIADFIENELLNDKSEYEFEEA